MRQTKKFPSMEQATAAKKQGHECLMSVADIPDCQMHYGGIPGAERDRPVVKAAYDAKIPSVGSWGYVCGVCFRKYGCKTGPGLGQKFLVYQESSRNPFYPGTTVGDVLKSKG